MKKICYSLLLALLLLPARIFAQSPEQARLLETAYKQKSLWSLELFFQNWADEVKPSDTVGLNPYTAEAYRLFSTFYQPLNLKILLPMDGHEEAYNESDWFIVQGSLSEISVLDHIYFTQEEKDSVRADYINRNISENEREYYFERDKRGNLIHRIPELDEPQKLVVDSVIDFRPSVSFDGRKIVYLTSGYEKLLDNFLKDEHIIDMDNNTVYPPSSTKESKERMNFFNRKAVIYYGHWGGYWQYETYPQAYTITFDRALQRAIVSYRIVYEGGVAVFEKRNGEWKFVGVSSRWIE